MLQHLRYVFDELKKRQLFLVTAESLTGGLIAKHITDMPGSSAVFWGGWVTYSEQAKHYLLAVPHDIMQRFGVVSIETAAAMAKGALAIASAASGSRCYALAVTGLAGPSGALPGLPVGTVCIACAGNEYTPFVYCEKYVFSGTRDDIREQTYAAAMQMLAQQLAETSKSNCRKYLDKIKNNKIQ